MYHFLTLFSERVVDHLIKLLLESGPAGMPYIGLNCFTYRIAQ